MSETPPKLDISDTDNTRPRLALRPAEAAQALGIGTRLLWSLTNRGEVPCVKLGRPTLYPVAQLESWLAKQTRPSAAGEPR